jgi:hypothetical protein
MLDSRLRAKTPPPHHHLDVVLDLMACCRDAKAARESTLRKSLWAEVGVFLVLSGAPKFVARK